jgi:hypothetical protein
MSAGHDEMRFMIKAVLKYAAVAAVTAMLFAPAVFAQILPPGGAALTPPPPPAPPPPSMAVPVVPQLDAMPSRQNAPPSRGSFGDRITGCLQDGAAAGLGPNDRASYSRACANR